MMSEWSVKQIHALQWSASNENAQGQKDEKKTKTKKTIRNQYSSSSRKNHTKPILLFEQKEGQK